MSDFIGGGGHCRFISISTSSEGTRKLHTVIASNKIDVGQIFNYTKGKKESAIAVVLVLVDQHVDV
jgi:hypothetical protein